MVVLNSAKGHHQGRVCTAHPLETLWGKKKTKSSVGPRQAQESLYLGTSELVITWDWKNSSAVKPGGCWRSRAVVLLSAFAAGFSRARRAAPKDPSLSRCRAVLWNEVKKITSEMSCCDTSLSWCCQKRRRKEIWGEMWSCVPQRCAGTGRV